LPEGFTPGTKPSELSYIFAAPELGNDDSTFGKIVFAETITEVTELYRTPETCAYFVQAEPKTDYTRSYTAALFLLWRDENQLWRIRRIERFYATGVGGWIECKRDDTTFWRSAFTHLLSATVLDLNP
jgi:hypothetical protein